MAPKNISLPVHRILDDFCSGYCQNTRKPPDNVRMGRRHSVVNTVSLKLWQKFPLLRLLISSMFSRLFSVSNYDNDSTFKRTTPPSWLGWLFNPDCMSIVWSLLSVLSISRPRYVSDERVSHSLSYPHPPITVYRVLVCAVVTTFGLVKAVLNYQNVKAPAIPWIDWAMAVPVFSTLVFFIPANMCVGD